MAINKNWTKKKTKNLVFSNFMLVVPGQYALLAGLPTPTINRRDEGAGYVGDLYDWTNDSPGSLYWRAFREKIIEREKRRAFVLLLILYIFVWAVFARFAFVYGSYIRQMLTKRPRARMHHHVAVLCNSDSPPVLNQIQIYLSNFNY